MLYKSEIWKTIWKLRRQNTWSSSSFKIRHKYQVQDLSVEKMKYENQSRKLKVKILQSHSKLVTNISFKIFVQRKICPEISVWCKTFPKVLWWKWIFLVKLMTSSRNWQNSIFRSTTLSQYIAILFAVDLYHHTKWSFMLYIFSTYVLILIIILCSSSPSPSSSRSPAWRAFRRQLGLLHWWLWLGRQLYNFHYWAPKMINFVSCNNHWWFWWQPN